jgi:rhamnose utilization protein RhaD (predicted bifunctional aldolase and dehydrogenase)/NAD(P)-dependent dehydrogenase (short-subunit alcohol dehydrogenase family)
MEHKWDSFQVNRSGGTIGDLIHATQLLGQESSFGLFHGVNTSIKMTVENLLGEEEQVLFVENGTQPSDSIGFDGFTVLRVEPLVKLLRLESLPDDLLLNAIACSRTSASAPIPHPDALTHAALPSPCILRAQPEPVMAIASTPAGLNRLEGIFGESLLILPFAPPGLKMAKASFEALQFAYAARVKGIYIQGHGLVVFGDTARIAYDGMVDMANQAVRYLEERASWKIFTPHDPKVGRVVRQDLAALRKAVSNAAGMSLILSKDHDPVSRAFLQRSDLPSLTGQGPATADAVAVIKRYPLVGRDVEAYTASYAQPYADLGDGTLPPGLDPAPRILLDPELGVCALGRTASEAQLAMQTFRHTIRVIMQAYVLEEYSGLPANDLLEAEAAAHAFPTSTGKSEDAPFTGEVALVTGGASGIGKACVESLLRRGACVVSLDINPKVIRFFDTPEYLGLECDLTDETAVLGCFETFTQAFGGLDMLVLNAGVFPAGCRIESLSLQEWQRVMRINLDSNLVILREAHPLLKQSLHGGRVLVNASKNVLAPGAGAAAYSASKAAVTQLARVAALEWGKDRIRVNLIHPDAIFDTGIWTEEVIAARAAHYGLTVQQYKTRNILSVELNSHYVGELVAEMLGVRFEKITGAQIPVDGGSDRVI